MKRLIQFLLVSMFTLSCLALCANAALTENQKNTLVKFTDDFLREAVDERHIVWYGGGGDFVPPSYQMKLVHVQSLYYTVGNARKKLVFMLNPEGYDTFKDYYFETQNSTGGYLKRGDYMILDCTAFISLMYKGALGLRFDYYTSGHISAWTTAHYLYDDYAASRRALDKDGNEIDIFQTIYADDRDKTKFSLASALTPEVQSTMEVGDIIVGNNANTELGHILFYAGDGYVYHSSSEPHYLPNGKIAGTLQRKEAISELTNESYTILKVLRINDGILDEDFVGYSMDYDFDALNTEKSIFDTKAPEIKSIVISNNFVKGNTKQITIDVTDEFGNDRISYFAGDGKKVLKSAGKGESGVMGIYIGVSATFPEDTSTLEYTDANHYELLRARGQYYIWAMDAAGNLSDRYRIIVGKDTSFVYQSPEEGEEELLGTYKADENDITTAVSDSDSTPDSSAPDADAGKDILSVLIPVFIILSVAVVVISLLTVLLRRKNKKE